MDDRTDSDLVQQARAGDRTAFGDLIERYAPMVKSLVYRLIGEAETVQDLTQEALLQAYLSLDSLRSDSSFRSWLYGITLNVCRSYLRSPKVEVFSLDAMLGGIYREDGPTPEEIVERLELRRVVWDAVGVLSPTNRAAVLLVYYDDFSLREAADILDISVPALKVRLHRSRHHLQASLTSLAPDQQGDKPMIPVKVVDVWRKEDTPLFQVVLYDEAGHRAMVIWVGEVEGTFILQGLLKYEAPRPMTPIFIARLLKAANASVEHVFINALKEEVYYATVRVRAGDQTSDVDARPSDALVLAIQVGAPIYVSPEVLDRAGRVIPDGHAPTGNGVAGLQQNFWRERIECFDRAAREALGQPQTEEEKQQNIAQAEQTILSGAFNKPE